MDKLKMHTPNRADDNFKKLVELFPNAVTETISESGDAVRAIDKDVLMQGISCTVVKGNEWLTIVLQRALSRFSLHTALIQ